MAAPAAVTPLPPPPADSLRDKDDPTLGLDSLSLEQRKEPVASAKAPRQVAAPPPFAWGSFIIVLVFGIFGQLGVRLGGLQGSLDKIWLLAFAVPPFSLVPALFHGFQLVQAPPLPKPIWGRMSNVLLLPLFIIVAMWFGRANTVEDTIGLYRWFWLLSVVVLTYYVAHRDAECAAIPDAKSRYLHALKVALKVVLGSLLVVVACKNLVSEYGLDIFDDIQSDRPKTFALGFLVLAFSMQMMTMLFMQVTANNDGVPTCVPAEFAQGWSERAATWQDDMARALAEAAAQQAPPAAAEAPLVDAEASLVDAETTPAAEPAAAQGQTFSTFSA